MLHAGSLNWTFTLGTGLFDPWTAGATAIVPTADVWPAQLPLLLKRHEATLFAAVPGIYRQMLRDRDSLDLPRLRHGLSAGEKLPQLTRERWAQLTGKPIYEAFGMSECSTFVSSSPSRPAPDGTLGYAQPGRHIAVLDDRGEPVPRGEPGILAVDREDPGLMLGYLRHPEELMARVIGPWFLTGDRVRMNPDGSITYIGRDDDMMNAGGYRVSPLEVEAALAEHPGVEEAGVTDVPVSEEATVIAAFYVAEKELDAAALSAHMSERLARYKQPRLYQWVQALPKSANGKLKRPALRALYETRDAQT